MNNSILSVAAAAAAAAAAKKRSEHGHQISRKSNLALLSKHKKIITKNKKLKVKKKVDVFHMKPTRWSDVREKMRSKVT